MCEISEKYKPTEIFHTFFIILMHELDICKSGGKAKETLRRAGVLKLVLASTTVLF
jgi:hypothetical protein